jgi:hydrogenase maturation protein HypF
MNKVVLSGGCFQNTLLTERTISLLHRNNHQVYWHQRVPPNDGGISLGQIAAHLMKHNSAKENVIENQPVKEIG